MPDRVGEIAAGQFASGSKIDLPCDIDAEKSVLSACLLNSEAADELCVALKHENFYRGAHRIIFEAILEIVRAGLSPDLISVADKLQSQNKLELAGDRAYLTELVSATNALSHWKKHSEIVKRTSIQRDLIRAAAEINALAYDAPDTISAVVERAEQALFNVTEKRGSASFESMEQLCSKAFDEIKLLSERKEELLGVPTGFTDVDKLFCGLRGGDLIVLAARPGVGKTSFALNLAVNAAKKDVSVAFFSLEMSSEQIAQRLLSSEARVELSKLRSGRLQPSDWQPIMDASANLSTLDLSIDDTPGLSILEARAKARRQLRKLSETGKLGLIVIDYLQLMTPPVQRRDGNRAVEVGEISRGLKILAKEVNVPVIALSQLNRSVEMRGGKYKRPMLSDLRESGSIEQDADIVMFIDRSMDEEEASNENRPDLGSAELQVAKHRNGPTRDITLSFQGDFTRFGNFVDDSHYN